MTSRSDFAGKVYPTSPSFRIGREHVRDFAHAVAAKRPEYTSLDVARSLGYPDLVAPPTFAVVIAQRCEKQLVSDPEAGIDFSRVVHTEEKFAYTAPLCAGDDVDATLTVERLREVGGHLMVTTRVDLRVAGQDRCAVTSTLVVRGAEGEAA